MTGWIKLHRSVSDHWVWNCEFSYGQAWIDLLCHASHKPNKFAIKGQLISLGIGEQARSEVTLSKAWKWSRNKVRRFLSNLEKDGMIERKTTHLTSIISICNYSNFQHCDTSGGTAKGQLKDSKRNTNKNVKNEKNDNKGIICYSTIKEIFNGSLTNANPIAKLTDKRKQLVKKLFDEFNLDYDKFKSYLEYMNDHPDCQWMFEKRPKNDGSGQSWNACKFEYFVSEKCFLNVKENL